jgi:hypothetical protein
MGKILTDVELDTLRAEPKPLPANWKDKLRGKARHGSASTGGSFEVRGNGENLFRFYARQSADNLFDFSVGLAYLAPDGTSYMLARFNGSSHEHTNPIEGDHFEDVFHIHLATERYLRKFGVDGMDKYARPTARFYDFNSAMDAARTDLGLYDPGEDTHPNLFT